MLPTTLIRNALAVICLSLIGSGTLAECLSRDPFDTPKLTLQTCTSFLDTAKDKQTKAKALNQIGWAHRVLDDLDASTAAFSKSLRLHKSSQTQRSLGWNYRLMKRYKKAERHLTRAIAMEDEYHGRLSRCVIRTDLKKFTKAIADCEIALSSKPTSLDALHFLALSFNELGQHHKALPHAKAAHKEALLQNHLYPRRVTTNGRKRHVIEYIVTLHLGGHGAEALEMAKEAQQTWPFNGFLQEIVDHYSLQCPLTELPAKPRPGCWR